MKSQMSQVPKLSADEKARQLTPRNKPDFYPACGALVDPNFLSSSIKKELRMLLKNSPLMVSQIEAFLMHASDMSQVLMQGSATSGKKQRDQIAEVQANAHRLLNSLRKLEQPALEALRCQVDLITLGSAPPIALSESVTRELRTPGACVASSAWDWVDALEQAAGISAAQYELDSTSKPELSRARAFVQLLADWVKSATGQLPPTSRETWFYQFATRLGEHLGMPIGPRVIQSGIGAAR